MCRFETQSSCLNDACADDKSPKNAFSEADDMFFFPRKSICRFAGANKRSEIYQYPIRAARHCKMELCKSAVSRSRGRRRKFRSYQNSTSVLGALQSGQGRVQEGEDQIQGAANCGQGRAQSLVGVNLKLVPENAGFAEPLENFLRDRDEVCGYVRLCFNSDVCKIEFRVSSI